MDVALEHLSAPDVYRWLVGSVVPRPIAWISTRSAAGVDNLAPFSFFTVASCVPPVLAFTHINPRHRPEKDTLHHLRETGECVLNIVSVEQLDVMNASCAEYPADVSEFDALGIARAASVQVAPPGVAQARVRYECRLRDVVTVSAAPQGGQLVLLNVLHLHVDDAVVVDGVIDEQRLAAPGKLGGDRYAIGGQILERARPRLPAGKV